MIKNNPNIKHSYHTKPTHTNQITKEKDILDIALWNKKDKTIKKINIKTEKETQSDHRPVIFNINTKEKLSTIEINEKIKMYHKYNWEKANKNLLENFNIPTTNQEIDREIEKLEHQINNITEEIPTKNVKRTNHGLDKTAFVS